jgi:hypothetical protein
MQTRRHWLILAGTAVVALTLGTPALAVIEANLGQRLRAGLKARTKAEHKFIDRVVILVRTGKLSKKTVDEVFFWARKRAALKLGAKKKRPMIYFQPALVRIAKKMEIKI